MQQIKYLDDLLKTSRNIKTLYDVLYQLEINNDRDNLNYEYTINNLKLYIEYERRMYDKLSYDELNNLVTYLNEVSVNIRINDVPNPVCGEENAILELFLNNHLAPLNRIINRGNFEIAKKLDLDTGLPTVNGIYMFLPPDNLFEEESQYSSIIDSLIRCLGILNLEKNKEIDKSIVIDNKYLIAYENQEYEDFLLKSNFNIDISKEDYYFDLINELQDSNIYMNKIKAQYNATISDAIKYMMLFTDEELEDSKIYNNYLEVYNFVETFLQLPNNLFLKRIKDSFEGELDNSRSNQDFINLIDQKIKATENIQKKKVK